jgi:hypothetical protein
LIEPLSTEDTFEQDVTLVETDNTPNESFQMLQASKQLGLGLRFNPLRQVWVLDSTGNENSLRIFQMAYSASAPWEDR